MDMLKINNNLTVMSEALQLFYSTLTCNQTVS
jgi:hypothetical protein